MPETKDIIPKLEIEKARNALEEAKILFDSEKYYGAANRYQNSTYATTRNPSSDNRKKDFIDMIGLFRTQKSSMYSLVI